MGEGVKKDEKVTEDGEQKKESGKNEPPIGNWEFDPAAGKFVLEIAPF